VPWPPTSESNRANVGKAAVSSEDAKCSDGRVADMMRSALTHFGTQPSLRVLWIPHLCRQTNKALCHIMIKLESKIRLNDYNQIKTTPMRRV
jgi:hypothetical protein